VAFFSQYAYASFGGGSSLPDGLLYGGGTAALRQLGLQLLAIPIVLITVFALSYFFIYIVSKGMHGIINEYTAQDLQGNAEKLDEYEE
jgi:ammonium transporter, Amt family